MWSRLDHYWSNVHQRDHRSGCLLKRFIIIRKFATERLSPRVIVVIIDFGKNLPMGSAKGPKIVSQKKQKKDMEDFWHIAPENGQSRKSDIYTFRKVVKCIFKSCPTQTLEVDPMLRLNLQEVLKATF